MQDAATLGAFARDLRERELIDCLSLNSGRIGGELMGRDRAIELWQNLLRTRASTSTVIEAADPIAGQCIVGFGADVLVNRAFVDREISNPRPGLNQRVIVSICSESPVVLSEAEIRSGNTRGGLDIAILYGCCSPPLSPGGASEVRAALAARFLENRQGYRINRVITETVGERERNQCLATHAWRELQRFEQPGGESRSMMIITRQDAMAVAASFINPLFHYRKPDLHLRDPDRQLLLAALDGSTDEEVSRKLDLTLPAVKKRWVSIFERTIGARPDLFPEAAYQNNRDKRGRQKRHHVLSYIRSHREELRPVEQ